jgi:hypothetical protein
MDETGPWRSEDSRLNSPKMALENPAALLRLVALKI